MDIGQAVKDRLTWLGYTGEISDVYLVYLTGAVEHEILGYTHLDEVPEALYSVWVDMACGQFLAESKVAGAVSGFDLEVAVKRVSEGDTTVEFAVGSGSMTPEARLDALIHSLTSRERLMRYRRLSW